jgi:predicted metal-dependent peptidase
MLKDIEEIGYKLERFHGVFYQLWSVSTFTETEKIPTCAVSWDKKNKNINYLVNPKFWATRDEYNKMFIVCHEMLHLILRHPMRRTKDMNPMAANIAQDICINEMLVQNFGFDRSKIQDEKALAWLDTVPMTKKSNETHIAPEREFEYYYNRMDSQNNKQQTVDDHSQWDSFEGIEDIKEAIKEALEQMEPEELEDLKSRIADQKAGTESLDEVIKVIKKIRHKQRWRKLFKHWNQRIEEEAEDWTRLNRRLNTLRGSSFILPAPHEREEKKEKGDVWLFLDTSGSCASLAQDFYDAANTIPTAHFNVRLFCFDTKIYEVKNNKLMGFGGTSFSCIESYLRQQRTYPAAVFVITDGYGDTVHPKHPDRWYWFLSDNGALDYIPKESRKFHINTLEPIGSGKR